MKISMGRLFIELPSDNFGRCAHSPPKRWWRFLTVKAYRCNPDLPPPRPFSWNVWVYTKKRSWVTFVAWRPKGWVKGASWYIKR